ncbi:hypothetical protein GCM10010353_64590 [Streptomyces chryseus]|uniref:4Fe-4S Wbl-type domain-containing protein n=1 Tax=Streptomyces chryseus TaxID=68186 RepID=A0ABQ3DX52_9ACTN|nr:hypothetical protein GCM10010353_64590 [Streptomyces chryseus]GHB17987.1 hypothetical protein GCM10010346_47400 [Streptomyces chryseus]
MIQEAARPQTVPAPPDDAEYKAVLKHATKCPRCFESGCLVGARLRRAEREARR